MTGSPNQGDTVKERVERIVCAAIHLDDGTIRAHQPKNIESGIVVCGLRHGNCFVILRESIKKGKPIQGFLTTWDRFVDRNEGALIAYAAGQTDRDVKTLFSEDLY